MKTGRVPLPRVSITLIAVVILALLLSAASGRDVEFGEPSGKREPTIYAEASDQTDKSTENSSHPAHFADLYLAMGSYDRQLRQTKSMLPRSTYARVNDAIQQAVIHGFEQGYRFEEIRAELGKAITWQEVPDDLRVGLTAGEAGHAIPEQRLKIAGLEDQLEALPEEQAKLAVVLYKSVDVPGVGKFFAFQNSLAYTENEGITRRRWGIYGALAGEDLVWAGVIDPVYSDSGPVMGAQLFLVDANIVDDNPVAIYVHGPVGTGRQVIAQSAVFRGVERGWELVDYLEEWDVDYWGYQTSSLTLYIGISDSTVNMKLPTQNIERD